MIIWLASYPRSGNTFFRVLLNNVFGIKTYSIYDDRSDIGADKALSDVVGHEFLPDNFELDEARRSKKLYFIKTHDYPDLASQDKVIYLLRDGRESTLSFYRYLNDYARQAHSLVDVIYGDTLFGGWSEHVLAWSPNNRSNTLLIKFEELVSDPFCLVDKIAEFIDKKPVSDSLPGFDELHEKGPRFFRSGKTDSWKNKYNEFEKEAFVLRHYAQMTEYGYTDNLPEKFSGSPELLETLRKNAALSVRYKVREIGKIGTLECQVDSLEKVRDKHNQEIAALKSRLTARPDVKSTEKQLQSTIEWDVRHRAEDFNKQGEDYFQKGELEKAEDGFLKAIQHDPGFADGYNNLGVLFWQKQDVPRALEFFNVALNLDPGHRNAIVNLGEILKVLGKDDDANILYESYLKNHPGDLEIDKSRSGLCTSDEDAMSSESLIADGEKAFSEGSIGKAIALFEEAIKIDPTNTVIYNNLVVAHWQDGNAGKSLSYLVDGLLVDKTDRSLVVNGCQILVELNQLDEAKQLYSGYLTRYPDDAEVIESLSAISSNRPSSENSAGPKKFVIFTAARSGSNQLTNLLRSHPDVECQFELFDPTRVISLGIDDEKLNDKDFRDNNPEAYLERLYSYFADKKAVGFKVVPCVGMRKLVDYLMNRNDIVKIVLERENRLLSFSSGLIARKTDQWEFSGSGKAKQAKVEFDEPAFFSYLAELNSWFGSIRESLQKSGQEAHYLEYNDLLDKSKQKELLEFLSVGPNISLKTSAREQNSDSYRDRFGNPEEVKRALDNAGYSKWLIDDGERKTAAQLNEKGESVFADGDIGTATKLFDEAYEADPNNAGILNNLGVAYWEAGEWEKSIAYMAQALEVDPDNRDAVINSAKILAALGRQEELHALCDSYLKQFPDDDEVSDILLGVPPEARSVEPHPAENSSASDAAVASDENLDANAFNQAGEQEVAELPANMSIDSKDSGADGNASHAPQIHDPVGGCIRVAQNHYTDDSRTLEAPKISIVIPSFNQGEFLEQTICSVLEQDYPDLELVIMDGGSTDGSVEIIRKYEDRLTYWQSQKDKGQYWAINEGFKRTSGEIMAWINSDDKFHPNSFNTIASIFDQRNDIDWVTGVPNIMDEEGEPAWVCSVPPVYSRRYYLAKKYDYPNYIQQEGTFWRRSLWEKAGGTLKTSLKMAGDLELWMRFFRYSRLYTAVTYLGCFRQHGGQKTASNLELYRKEALKELNKEIVRFKKSKQTLPKDAPIIIISDGEKLSRNPEPEERKRKVFAGDGDILVTAIVSTYNSERYIDGCLQDLMSQTVADRLEVIVVDSGSQQNERAVVESYQQKYPNIRYFRTDERETIYAAWNRAILEARGEYISNANTDDRHRRDAYEKMVEVLQRKPDVAVVYADSFVTTSANATFAEAPVDGRFQWPEFDARLLFSVCYVGPQPMWRRSLHEKYGYFDPEMKVAGDYDFWLRLASNERFQHIHEELGLYLLSSASVEHAYAAAGATESEVARQRNWPVEWGERPAAGGSYLVRTARENGRGGGQDEPAALVSIIMPTKNRVELLGRAIDSIVAQTYPHWELIVVNDGGADIAPVVDSRSPGGRIHCINLEQSTGQAAARNIALQEAKGQIICYLDDDDVYLHNHLETVVTALSRDGRPFVYTDAVLVPERLDNGVFQEEGERSNPYTHDKYSRDRLLVSNYIPINTWAHWKVCLDEVGTFDESLNCYEDWEFLLRFSARYAFTHVKQVTVEVMYRVDRVDNVTRQRLADSADAYRAIYRRHGDNLPEKLVRERDSKLQAIEYNAENYRQNDQSQLDAVINEGGDYAGDGGSAGVMPDAQRVQYLREQFLCRVEESSYILPSIHLIMVADESNVAKIADTIDSLDQQIYAGWGLSVISTEPVPHQDFDALPMLEWIQSEDVGQSFVDATRQSPCDWVASAMPGDTLEPNALSVFVDYINQNPDWKFIYSDEDCVDVSGAQVSHKFKPDINPDYLCSCPYTGSLSLVHRDMLEQLDPDLGMPTASFYDFALKVMENHGASAIGHIPVLLYHQLQDNERREARDTWVQPVLEAYVRRNGIEAGVLPGAANGTCLIDYRCSGTPAVCIAIYVGSDLARVERTVSSLLNKTAYLNRTIRLGVDRALAPQFEKYRSERLSVDPLDKDVSRCAYFDSLAQTVDAEYMVFMDSGVVVLQDNWLERLLAQGQRPEVGAVGIRLLSPQNKIAHAGILTGMGSFGVGGCIGEGDTLEQEGYMQRSQVVQNLSAVSSACMLVERSLFQSLQGFDAGIAVQLYCDVDFCLRVREAGQRIVWTPFVTMLISEDRLDTYAGDGGIRRVEQDSRQVTSTWLQRLARDPAYNRNLTLKRTDFSRETGFKPVWDPQVRDLPRITGCGIGAYVPWAYRVAQPLDALSAAGKACYSNVPFEGKDIEYLPSVVEMERIQPDVLLLHNTLHDNCLDALRQYRQMNKVFRVFSQDDLIFAVPPKSSCFNTGYKDIKKRLRTCLSLVDRLVVTTEPLADELSGFISDIRVVPNRLDAGIWGALESHRGCGVKPRVGWAGAMQHHGDLEILADAVRETADEVDWIFMGMCPDFLRPYVKEVHEYIAFSAYPQALAKLNLDLAVAPLEHNRFNRCKSNLRLLEYGAMGWPVIASDIEPYREAPVHRVSNQPRAWVNAIREHAHDLETTWKAGDTLREWVRANYLQQHLDEWLDALDPIGGPHRELLVPGKASGL